MRKVALTIINTATTDMRIVENDLEEAAVDDLLAKASEISVAAEPLAERGRLRILRLGRGRRHRHRPGAPHGPWRIVLVVPRPAATPHIIGRWADPDTIRTLEEMITGIPAGVR